MLRVVLLLMINYVVVEGMLLLMSEATEADSQRKSTISMAARMCPQTPREQKYC